LKEVISSLGKILYGGLRTKAAPPLGYGQPSLKNR